MQRRPEFSFPGSPVNARPREEEEEVRWLQASRQGSPDSSYYNNSSGSPSPKLWAHHQLQNRAYPGGSPPSRAHVIAGYRREMLDLVRGLPESAYELSLRDIVEHHHPSSSSPSSSAPLPAPPSSTNTATAREPAADDPAAKQSGAATSKKQGRRKQQRSRSLERSVSLDTGLLIKFFLPLSIGGRGGKKKKVSPKPDAAKHSKKKKQKQGTKKEEEARQKTQDEEWWTKSEFSEEASESSSRTNSTGSSNSSTGTVTNGGGSNPRPPVRSRSRKRNGCYAFFRGSKTKNGVSQD